MDETGILFYNGSDSQASSKQSESLLQIQNIFK